MYDYFYDDNNYGEYYYAEAGFFYCPVEILVTHKWWAKCGPDCPGEYVERLP